MVSENQHIDWIDGVKGVAILSVILLHCLPDLGKVYAFLHLEQAVPVFVFITAYLLTLHYKSFKEYYRKERLWKMLRTVLPPFMIATLCVSVVHWVHWGELPSLKALVFNGGCLGPGSYYLPIYLSIYLLMPFIIEFVRRTPLWCSFVVFLLISILCEYGFMGIWEYSHIQAIYRLAFVRYLMVVWLGCAYTKFSKVEYLVAWIVALLGAVFGVLNLKETFFYQIVPDYWNTAHWFNVLYVLIPIELLRRMKYGETIKWIGQHSWLIFCFQMFVFWCVMIMYKY